MRRLKEIRTREISLVKTPANRRPFLFFKSVDYEKAKYCVCPECGYAIKCAEGLRKSEECPECGVVLIPSETKKLEVSKMVDEILEILKEMEDGDDEILSLEDAYEAFTGEKFSKEEIEKAGKMDQKVRNAIKTAYNILNKWKDSLPDDLKRAVALLAKYTAPGKYPYPKPYKKDEDLEKAGAKLSKASAAEILKAMKILEGLLPADVKKQLEEEQKEETVIEKIERIENILEKLSKWKDGEAKEETGGKEEDSGKEEEPDDIAKKLATALERIEKLEKVKGKKKGLDGDDEEGLEKGDDVDLYPSIKLS